MYVCWKENTGPRGVTDTTLPCLTEPSPATDSGDWRLRPTRLLTLTENRECWEGVGSAGGQADRDGYSKISVTIPHSNNGQRNWSGWFVISLTRSRACKKKSKLLKLGEGTAILLDNIRIGTVR